MCNMTSKKQKCLITIFSSFLGSTLDLSKFNVNVMTDNNEAYQPSPYDPVFQKWPFFFVQTPWILNLYGAKDSFILLSLMELMM